MSNDNKQPKLAVRVFMSLLLIFLFLAGCTSQADLYVNRFSSIDETRVRSDVDVTLNQTGVFPPGTELKILQWTHFVPSYDEWFDEFATEWGRQNGVTVIIDRYDLDEGENALELQLEQGGGYTMIELLFPPSAWIEDLHDLTDLNQEAAQLLGDQRETCRASSYLPTIDSYYAFCHGYAPSPGNYLINEWSRIGYPHGPSEWSHLVDGGREIINQTGLPVGIGISPEIDSEVALRSILWSYGGAIQDAKENVVLDSAETVQAVEFMAQLYDRSMNSTVLEWKPSSNNDGMINGELSFIQNSLSAYRTMQKVNPERAENIGFTQPLAGPAGALAPAHVWMIYVVPQYVEENELRAAKEFMLYLAANYSQAVFSSELYNFPAWSSTPPQLQDRDGWLAIDPFDTVESDKLSILADVQNQYVNFGHPGVANPAISQVYDEKIMTKMVERVALGQMSAEESVKIADERVKEIFEIWRQKGLVGGSE